MSILLKAKARRVHSALCADVDDDSCSLVGDFELLVAGAELVEAGSAECELDSSETGWPLLASECEATLLFSFRSRSRVGSNIVIMHIVRNGIEWLKMSLYIRFKRTPPLENLERESLKKFSLWLEKKLIFWENEKRLDGESDIFRLPSIRRF